MTFLTIPPRFSISICIAMLTFACSKESSKTERAARHPSQGNEPVSVATQVPSGLSSPASNDSAAASEPASRTRRTPVLNAAPLGLEVGFANLAGVRETIGELEAAGTNRYSQGPMFRCTSRGLGIADLKEVQLVFDRQTILQAVIMTFPKHPKETFELLKEKYRVVEDHINTFLNKGSAVLEQGESWIELDAPHLSFEMEVRYVTKSLRAVADSTRQRAQSEQRSQLLEQL